MARRSILSQLFRQSAGYVNVLTVYWLHFRVLKFQDLKVHLPKLRIIFCLSGTAVGDDTSEIPEIRTDTAKPSKHKAALQKKLQAKLDKVKETKRAEESESVAQTTSVSKRLRSLRGKSMVTRFETEEEIARGEELEKTLKTRSRFREAVREAKKKVKVLFVDRKKERINFVVE